MADAIVCHDYVFSLKLVSYVRVSNLRVSLPTRRILRRDSAPGRVWHVVRSLAANEDVNLPEHNTFGHLSWGESRAHCDPLHARRLVCYIRIRGLSVRSHPVVRVPPLRHLPTVSIPGTDLRAVDRITWLVGQSKGQPKDLRPLLDRQHVTWSATRLSSVQQQLRVEGTDRVLSSTSCSVCLPWPPHTWALL